MEVNSDFKYTENGYIIKKDDGSEEVLQIPYNLNNIFITEDDIIKLLKNYNVYINKINHLKYFQQAFVHKSYCKKNLIPQEILEKSKQELNNPPDLLELQNKSYERLEYFGDRVIKITFSMYLFHRYPNENEGFMTRLQTKLEDKKNLAAMSKEIGLGKYFIISKQIEQLNGRNLEKIHEDIFEAFMGAMFLSNGLEPCVLLLLNLLETLIDYSDKLYRDNNYKDKLLRHHHKEKWKFPKYVMIYYEGPAHKRKYIMGVEKQDVDNNTKIEDRCISFGKGNSKKEGEQNAAKMALIIYGLLKNDQYNNNDIYYPPWDLIQENNDTDYKIFNDKNVNNDYLKNKTSDPGDEPMTPMPPEAKSKLFKEENSDDDSVEVSEIDDSESDNSELSEETDSDED